jgi:type I restriction enzyme S subunit
MKADAGKMRDDMLTGSLVEIYDLLYERFGPQRWWPAKTQFEVIVGAILTQSTSWRNVEKAISNLENAGVLSVERICQIKVTIPASVAEQKRIGEVLSAYDDLIENNRRRIKLLEQSARLLYKEWFVHLRFPGHEHVNIIDGVPDGWEKKPFSELATFLNGFAFKPSHLGDIGLPIVKIPELRDGPTEKTPRNPGDSIPEKYVLNNGDVLFSWSGTLLVNIWNHGRALLNQHLFKVVPITDNLRGFVSFALQQALGEFQNQTIGSTMKHIRRDALEKVATLVPDKPLLDEFDSYVTPILEQVGILQRQVTASLQARDLLLPRLMNGEVVV